MHQQLKYRSALGPALLLASLLLLTGCGPINIRPEQTLPKPLLTPMASQIGVVMTGELRNYKHEETRSGTDWKIELGPGHVKLVEQMFAASFKSSRVFKSLDEARVEAGLNVLFIPRIEQYSFATARDTSGGYYAVTIRYRIDVLTPAGEEADSLTLTGYGSSLDKGGAGKSLERATVAAMRDAAAKFLVQLPRQPRIVALRNGEPLSPGLPATEVDEIETVPIEGSKLAAR
ncbi:MAG: hypothetical protein ABI859_06235 [Pseudomonadota bacterium]